MVRTTGGEVWACRMGLVALGLWAASGCVGAADERARADLDDGETSLTESCAAAADAVASGSREADVDGEVTLDAVSEWGDTLAVWSSLQAPDDVDEWRIPLRDGVGATLEPWVRLEMSDTAGHAWLELCTYYEGPGAAACFVGSTPAARPGSGAEAPGLSGCCRTTDEYGGADTWPDVGSPWADDSGALLVTVRSPDATCAGYWLMAAGSRR